jgi:hypothetical protein
VAVAAALGMPLPVALIEALIARPDGALGPERLVALEQRCAGAAALLVGPDWWSPRRRGCSRAYWSLMRRRWPGWRKRSAVGWAVHLYGRAADQVARAIGSPGCLSRERLDCLPSLLTGVALTIGAGRADMRSACHETCLEESRLEHAGNADTRPRRYARGPAAVRRGPCVSPAGCLAPTANSVVSLRFSGSWPRDAHPRPAVDELAAVRSTSLHGIPLALVGQGKRRSNTLPTATGFQVLGYTNGDMRQLTAGRRRVDVQRC